MPAWQPCSASRCRRMPAARCRRTPGSRLPRRIPHRKRPARPGQPLVRGRQPWAPNRPRSKLICCRLRAACRKPICCQPCPRPAAWEPAPLEPVASQYSPAPQPEDSGPDAPIQTAPAATASGLSASQPAHAVQLGPAAPAQAPPASQVSGPADEDRNWRRLETIFRRHAEKERMENPPGIQRPARPNRRLASPSHPLRTQSARRVKMHLRPPDK